ncbi:MAG TPA: response regulator transcription factor [Anaerolineae bacterium]|nr:response regulator transcription factor [Anaerolineae bacterium]
MAKTIMLVDDEERLISLVKAYLIQEGYRVVTARNGRDAMFIARDEKPDLIVLDIMMPEMDGFEFMRIHHRERDTPVIILSARVDETDRVLGLELGADDYVTKPFSPRELTARIKAVLRRTTKDDAPIDILRCDNLLLDRTNHLVKLNDETVDLTPSEFDLLATLMASPGRAYSRIDLLDSIQGTAFEGYERTIDVHIKNIRAKIEENPRSPRYIETVYGVGYRFAPE